MGIPSIGRASSGGIDNLQAAYSGAQASAEGGQYPNGNDPANVAPAGSSAAQSLPWPPGVAGELAQYIYDTAPRPVPEVAIAATLGLLAGVCGRAFTISDKGLNLYILLIARSGIGKEAMHRGINDLLDMGDNEPAQRFADFDDFASSPALAKAVLDNPSFVNVVGEIGRRLKRMNRDSDKVMQEMRSQWTNLYEKSGAGDRVPGIRYSNAEDSRLGIRGAAYSLIGETTPATFLEALTPDMAEDGFLSRFTMIEYDGARPPLNKDREADLLCLETWKALLVRALPYGKNINVPERIQVAYEKDGEAERKLDAFGEECDQMINSTEDEWLRQMWNRAHMKALKIAALLACADNSVHPVINYRHASWALLLVRRDINTMTTRLNNGDVGMGDATRETKLLKFCRDYIVKPLPASYGVPASMHEIGIVPRLYLQKRANSTAAFHKHHLGTSFALDKAIQGLIGNGHIMQVDKAKMVEAYSFHGDCYRLLNIPDGKK
ncbi:MAG: DUF3987 domain-containing protein [Actinobacteria bacterium]|nr:DUF3987 domain-containing protein [Actinomycetota bacterium]